MEIEIAWEPDALSAIEKTFEYVNQFSFQSASKLAIELVEFGNNLYFFPDKFKLCGKPALKKRGFRCVTFRNHIFVHKLVGNQLRIYKIFHDKQNPRKLSVK